MQEQVYDVSRESRENVPNARWMYTHRENTSKSGFFLLIIIMNCDVIWCKQCAEKQGKLRRQSERKGDRKNIDGKEERDSVSS